jgi:hypothetical protein
MMRRILLLFLTSFLTGPDAGFAIESDPLHLTGSRVRLYISDRSTAAGRLSSRGQMQTGTVLEVRGDTLVFTAEHQSTPTLVPTASLMGLEVNRGKKRSHVVKGAGLGFLAGVLVGGVVGYASAVQAAQNGDDLAYLEVPAGMVVGGGVGIVVGAVIGTRRTGDRWEPQKLPISVGFLPGPHGIGLSVGLRN